MKPLAINPGDKFGRITIQQFSHGGPNGRHFLCRCECGRDFTARGTDMVSGKTTSCGCFRSQEVTRTNTKHNHTRLGWRSPTYGCWANMIQRCTNPNSTFFRHYGGRGITVCERWMDFSEFLKDMGEKPSQQSIERLDNNGNYNPENVVWATKSQQSINKRTNITITFDGKTQNMSVWAKERGLSYPKLRSRIVDKGWTAEMAFTEP